MKREPLSKIDKRNKTTWKNVDDEIMSKNCDAISVFAIYGQFGAVLKPDFKCIVWKINIFINRNILSYKNWKTELKCL